MQTETNTTTTTPAQQALTRLYCGHTTENAPRKIPHRNVIGCYCYNCNSWVASMIDGQVGGAARTQPVQAAKHTSTPWKTTRPHPNPATAASLIEIFPSTGGFDGPHSTQAIASLFCAETGTTQAANADLIVRAVNHHAALIAALERCLPYVDRIRGMTGGDGDLTALTARAALVAAKG